MKKTLLEIVQDTLTAIKGDKVNSISDTEQSVDIAKLVERTYFYFIEERLRSWLGTLTQMDAPASASSPTKMKLPDSISEIFWIKYDKKKAGDTNFNFDDVKYIEPKDFVDFTLRRNADNTNIDTITDPEYGVTFLIQNDVPPTYWTSFDDTYLVFDSYDSGIDSTLQNSKTILHGTRIPAWTSTDAFIPELPEKMFPQFVEEVISAASITDRQTVDPVSSSRARKLKTFTQQRQWRHNGKPNRPDYGRK